MSPNTRNKITPNQQYKSFKSLKRELTTLANARGWDIVPKISCDDIAYLKDEDLKNAYLKLEN